MLCYHATVVGKRTSVEVRFILYNSIFIDKKPQLKSNIFRVRLDLQFVGINGVFEGFHSFYNRRFCSVTRVMCLAYWPNLQTQKIMFSLLFILYRSKNWSVIDSEKSIKILLKHILNIQLIVILIESIFIIVNITEVKISLVRFITHLFGFATLWDMLKRSISGKSERYDVYRPNFKIFNFI